MVTAKRSLALLVLVLGWFFATASMTSVLAKVSAVNADVTAINATLGVMAGTALVSIFFVLSAIVVAAMVALRGVTLWWSR